MSQFQCADHPLRPATHRCHGGPLPRHQANGPQAHLRTPEGFNWNFRKKTNIRGISSSFPELSPIPRQITYVLLTRSPLVYPEGPYRSTCMFKTRRQR